MSMCSLFSVRKWKLEWAKCDDERRDFEFDWWEEKEGPM